MKIIRSVKKMQQIGLSLKNKRTIALVPTMGYLHNGHLSLITIAQKKADVTVTTIFINPTQFGKNEDLSKYPRDEKGDLKKLRKLGVDYVFIPKTEDMYAKDNQVSVHIGNSANILCGKSRPTHFDGVATVVLKLFNIIQPNYAVFGKKDYQQLVIIEQMARDLNLPVKILSGKIAREKDGLAMSSRNAYLNGYERRLALCLSLGLKAVKRACLKKSPGVKEMKKAFLSQIPKDKRIQIDYIECRDKNDLSTIKKYKKGKTLVATAIYIGKTRLIDNITI